MEPFHEPAICPFRARHETKHNLSSAMSWCAHHEFSDSKACNPSQPCATIVAIAKEPDFRIQTALLWVRSKSDRSRPAVTQSEQSSTEQVPTIEELKRLERTNTYRDPGQCIEDGKTTVDYDLADLGLLHLHRDRLASAAEALGWRSIPALYRTNASIAVLRSAIEAHIATLSPLSDDCREMLKLRVLIDRNGMIDVDSVVTGHVTSPSNLPLMIPTSLDIKSFSQNDLCKVYLDRQPTRPSALTSHKTTHRCCYDTARQRAGITKSPPTDKEVLLYNPYGEIMEASLCTVYFHRDGRWVTPATICGPHTGVTRRLAIENGLVKQGTIELRDLVVDEEVWLSNAVRGFFKGKLTCDPRRLSESVESKEVLLDKLGAGPFATRHHPS